MERGTLGDSRIEANSNNSRRFSCAAADLPAMTSSNYLPSPFGNLGCALSDLELRETAYEILSAACRSTGVKLTYIRRSERTPSPSADGVSPSSSSSSTPSSRRSLTSTTASKMKKALGLNSSRKRPVNSLKRPATIWETVRVQMGVSEKTESRTRKGLIRVAASQLGKRVESLVLPLELLQQFKASDFPDQGEYEACQIRQLKVLQTGLLLHPRLPLEKSDAASQRLRQIVHGASERPIETGKNSESMQVLRSAVMSLACRSSDGSFSETCHWADGFPLNLHLYQKLLEACFDSNEEGSITEEIDEVLELIKKTWVILGIDQILHNISFLWVLFHNFVTSGQVDTELLLAADNQLAEVARDAKATKDPVFSEILSSTLSSIMDWSEQRLLAYHDTFNHDNIDSMQNIVSLGVSAAKILVEDISHEYRRKRREETDVARSRIDTYIRSSLRTAFAQRMVNTDSSRRLAKNQTVCTPVLSILAKDTTDLASKENKMFSPILKKWHPLAAGVAAATLHSCYGNELKQVISNLTELTPDSLQVLKAADKLEKDLVQIAVEDSVDSEDGGKSLIREMPPYEAEYAIANLVKAWIKTRVDRLKEWVDNNLQEEDWNPMANKERLAPSAIKALRIVDETLDAFFQLPIPMHPAMLPELVLGLDKSLQHYVSMAKSGCGTKDSFIPALPALTRCESGSKFWKKKGKSKNLQIRNSQVGTMNENFDLPQLCVRMNTLNHIRTTLENLEKKVRTCLRNVESAQTDVSNGLETKFVLTLASSQEGIQQLCEAAAYKVIFQNLSHVLWDSLYVGEPAASSRIGPLLKELDPHLEMISTTVHNRVRSRLITALMKASFYGFLLVLLAGGPSRAFAHQDYQMLDDDFRSLKDLYLADGDGLPEDLVEKAATQVRSVLPLFRTDTENLIKRLNQITVEEANGYAGPPTSVNWCPTEANTILRVLCYRNDPAASKFLKKTYNLPKTL